ncbi:flavin reductase family protein [Sphingopyxis sp. DBS4]|uniref:flavin reductase family protein n=1 Tax=Sphingopyxis sp. DBS4 TaxID=2968500 RepID=UPI00214ACA93|nr:flavin reductase family protein [Sphingopyxis sp. DBS4]
MATNADRIAFRNALGSFATGVTIVTTCDKAGQDCGLTANSFNSVSLDPPMVLWSLARDSLSMEAFRDSEYFAVHVLAADQEPLSNGFARRGADKFAGLTPDRGAGNVPLLAGCAARFQCRTAYRYEGGDHVIFVGEVIAFDHDDRAPLLFHGGRYALAARRAAALTASNAEEIDTPGSFGEDFLGYLLGRAHFQLYGRMQACLARHRLDATDHFVISILGIQNGRTAAEVEGMIGFTGARITPEHVASLSARGIVRPDPATDRLWLTDTGRGILIELAAAAKAAEEEALETFDDNEAALLKHLLKHVIRHTDPGLPDPWAPADAA